MTKEDADFLRNQIVTALHCIDCSVDYCEVMRSHLLREYAEHADAIIEIIEAWLEQDAKDEGKEQ